MGAGTDGVALRQGILEARRAGGSVIWCHNGLGHEDIPNWLAGRIDAQNIFDGAPRGDYHDGFYRYLNVGLNVPFSTGTDWFVYDFSRVYVAPSGGAGEAEPEGNAADSSQSEYRSPHCTLDRWLGALAAGRSFITNGTFLELHVDGHSPGETIDLQEPASVEVEARGIGREAFDSIELVLNGEVVGRAECRPVSGVLQADLKMPLALGEPCWVALRLARSERTNEFGKPLFAHTSPIYVRLGGRSIFMPAVAEELLAEMERSIVMIKAQGYFGDDAERERVLDVYREGIGLLQEKLSMHQREREHGEP
jgi:hypothetical protein